MQVIDYIKKHKGLVISLAGLGVAAILGALAILNDSED